MVRRLHAARMWKRSLKGPVRAGTSHYQQQLEEELKHYSKLHAKSPNLFEPVPDIWDAALNKATERIVNHIGMDWPDYIAERLQKDGARMLSLGCGAGGVELVIAAKATQASYVCVDVNPALFDKARKQAAEGELHFEFASADLNTAEMNWGSFDIVLCHASLHHLVELEHIMEGVRRSLVPEGELIVIDINAPNGFRMAPETKRVAGPIFVTLPARYRLNHTAYGRKWLDNKIYNPPAMMTGMECQRSAEVLPMLRRYFQESTFVPYFSLCRRFFDTMYGPNYDLSRPLDRALFEWIWELDCEYLRNEELPPESFFGIYHA
jgi:ubiquinone/menaquinone biosynthesis C-methylase UbiE